MKKYFIFFLVQLLVFGILQSRLTIADKNYQIKRQQLEITTYSNAVNNLILRDYLKSESATPRTERHIYNSL
jgi:cell division protein FtsL